MSFGQQPVFNLQITRDQYILIARALKLSTQTYPNNEELRRLAQMFDGRIESNQVVDV